MNCDFTLCRHNRSAELKKEGLCTCKSPKKFCKYLQLKEQIVKMKRCEICKHKGIKTCQYANGIKNCLENNRKLFELREIKENDRYGI